MSQRHVRAAQLILPLPWRDWSPLDSRSFVLLYIASNPQSTMRQMSRAVGLSESHIAKVIHGLREAGALEATRSGQRNTHSVNRSAPLRHPIRGHDTFGELHDLLLAESPPAEK
jgi:predicted HTH transcriptional regulator